MLAKSFGKRAVPPAPAHGYTPAGSDPDGVSRVIPKAVWDGPNGALLRRHPDASRRVLLFARVVSRCDAQISAYTGSCRA